MDHLGPGGLRLHDRMQAERGRDRECGAGGAEARDGGAGSDDTREAARRLGGNPGHSLLLLRQMGRMSRGSWLARHDLCPCRCMCCAPGRPGRMRRPHCVADGSTALQGPQSSTKQARHTGCGKSHESRGTASGTPDWYDAAGMRIFVSIASYCDPLLPFTIARALDTAAAPDRLHFGVVDQSPPGSARLQRPGGGARLSELQVPARDARGPCWARAMAMTLYNGEAWFLQLDSHMDFDAGWDEQLIAQAQALGAPARGLALSSYPNAFVLENGVPVRRPTTGTPFTSTKALG
ncbi:MAG: hypothetical protein EOO24_16215 [Comamonadaceae bacterium]|nr:MAG: hypothetical protein EOO24_16215 [Comamonadaceae bacterium]